jgi:long-chain acyl-CoA synthetase
VVGALMHSRVLARVALPSLWHITSTGDILPPAYISVLRRGLPHALVMPMYGLTEWKRVSIMPHGMLDGRERSAGLPLPGTSARVIAAGKTAAPGVLGELFVRGPHVTDGYWGDPKLTEERFVVDPVTGERELHTATCSRATRMDSCIS